MFDPALIYFVTVRCLQGRRFLRPSDETRTVLEGVLARAARRHGVELFCFNTGSNHIHLLVRAKANNLPRFMQFLLTNVSKKVGKLIDWRGAFWERRYSAQPVLDDAALLQKVQYVLAHGPKEGLVRTCAEWPGLSSLRLMLDGKPRRVRWFNWTRRCRNATSSNRGRRTDERWAEEELLQLTPLPISGFDRLRTVRRFLRESVRAIEQWARAQFETVLGVSGVLSQSPQHRPQRPKRKPAPLCHTTSPALRSAYLNRYRSFADAYLTASAAWRGGNLDAQFPQGAVRPFFWPMHSRAAHLVVG
jgi:REP element-mobilizing transposase RayT